MTEMSVERELLKMYKLMRAHFGYRNWWPGETSFEVCIGAILTQNTAWSNVKKAVENLKNGKLLSSRKIFNSSNKQLSFLIKPSGYFNQKARTLKAFCRFLIHNYNGSCSRMSKVETSELRNKLLSVKGIGPETADSILLYACNKPVFVIDAYTKRIFSRHGFFEENIRYDRAQFFFETNLKRDISFYNDYHAQIVETGKNYCRKKPGCEACPLKGLLTK